MSPWMRIPPDPMDNMHNAIASFTLPKSYLTKRLKMYIATKDESKPSPHGIPDIVAGATDELDTQLSQILL
jgi:hypothetical protein